MQVRRGASLPTDQNSGTILPESGEKAGGMGDGRFSRDKASKRAGAGLDGDVPHSQQPPAVGNPLAGGELPTAPHAVLPASSVDALEREVLGLRAQLRSAQEDRGRDRDLLSRMLSLLEESLPDFKRSADAEQVFSQLRSELQKLRDAETRLTRAEVILAKEQVPAAREAFSAPPPELDTALSRERIAQLIKQGLKGHEEVHRLLDDAIERQKLRRDVLQPLLQRYVDALVGLHLSREEKQRIVARVNFLMRSLGLRAAHGTAVGPIGLNAGSLRIQTASRRPDGTQRRTYHPLGTTFPDHVLLVAEPRPSRKSRSYKYLGPIRGE